MATYIKLQFNDSDINLSTSSFLFKQSKLLQSIDIDEDNTIPILCSRSYILDENGICLFDDKYDLSFMFTLLPNKFLEVCKFLDIICYENIDNAFSKQFITYVMTNIKKEINTIKYFMQNEIRSIINYLNKEDINLQIKSCTPAFYALYLTEYKEEVAHVPSTNVIGLVIKHNRLDIFELSTNKSEYYRYIHKYDNHLTFFVKETQEYKTYVINISNKLFYECKNAFHEINLNNIKNLCGQGANINARDVYRNTPLHYTTYTSYATVVMYLIKYGANVNLQNKNGQTALHYASKINDNFEVIKCLVKYGANVNLQDINGNTALHFASKYDNNLRVIKYLIEQGTNINLQNKDGNTALHIIVSEIKNIFILFDKNKIINTVIQYFVELGADINIQNNAGQTAL